MTVFNDTFDTATPAGDDSPTFADDEMRLTKAALQERENVDHYWPLTGTEVSDIDAGEHRKITLRTGSAPTAVADKGFVYAKDVSGKAELFYRDEDSNEVQITTGGVIKLTSAALLGILANDTFLTAVDQAGTGTVNLIKAGTNDLSTLPDSAEMASDAAPVEDEAIANKKYVDDQVFNSLAGGDESNGEATIGDLEIKWGDGEVLPSSTSALTFSGSFGLSAFSNNCFQVIVCDGEDTFSANDPLNVYTITASGFTVVNTDGSLNNRRIRFMAIGR